MTGNLEALDYCDIAECYKKAKKIDKMLEMAQKAVELDNQLPEVQKMYCVAYVLQGREQSDIELLNQGIEILEQTLSSPNEKIDQEGSYDAKDEQIFVQLEENLLKAHKKNYIVKLD